MKDGMCNASPAKMHFPDDIILFILLFMPSLLLLSEE